MAAPSKPKSSSGSPKPSASHGGGAGVLAAGVGALVAGILLCNPLACAATIAGAGALALAAGTK